MKKLVKLDENLRLTEIDMKATRRQAEMVRDYIANAPEAERQKYEYDKKVMPLVNAFLDGSLEIPWLPMKETTEFADPYDAWFIMEGQAPQLVEAFGSVYYKFKNMIGASASEFSLSTHESGEYILEKYRVEKDGELYEWCWFED
jgi:hypothetical protein